MSGMGSENVRVGVYKPGRKHDYITSMADDFGYDQYLIQCFLVS